MKRYANIHLMEYLPKRYEATAKQENDRQVIYNFKNGYCHVELMERFVKNIESLKNFMGGTKFRVCFIPASTHTKTIIRYKHLAAFIKKETGIASDIETIMPKVDHEAGHITGKKANPAEDFVFKKEDIAGTSIILIDDIITRGTTFTQTANRLIELGATLVTGLFLAKTINPDWII